MDFFPPIFEAIRLEVEDLLQKHHIHWTSIEVWETSDGYRVEIVSPVFEDFLTAERFSELLEKELGDPNISLSLVPFFQEKNPKSQNYT